MTRNCVLCGCKLVWTSFGEAFCPNHGIIPENQEWDEPYDAEEDVKEMGEKTND